MDKTNDNNKIPVSGNNTVGGTNVKDRKGPKRSVSSKIDQVTSNESPDESEDLKCSVCKSNVNDLVELSGSSLA